MKHRKRQYLYCFLWSSRIMITPKSVKRSANKSLTFQVIMTSVLLFLVASSSFPLNSIVQASEFGSVSPRVVFTKQGPVQGFLGPGNVGAHYQPQPDGSYLFKHYGGRPVVEIFKGIPYASPPTGNLRYESPTPPPLRSRTQIYNANVSKPACPSSYSQILNRTSVPGDPIRALKKTMELEADDCLYLDAYLPLNSNKNRGTGLPVLVYANSQMDDPQNPFDGSSIAAIGNIIVITFRYRVGVLGFVKPGFTDDIRTNFGLWDQLAALQWIKENVEEFGGDQNNITFMAYDLDATLAGLLSLSPVSQAYNGLFHRLILLNGSPFSPHSINHQPQKTTFHLAHNLRCTFDERTGDLASCFRRTPVPQLFGSAESIGAPLLTYPFAPIADGTLVPIDVSREDQRNIQSVLDMLGKYDLLCGIKEGPVLPRTGRPILRDIDLSSFVTAAIKLNLKLENDVEPSDGLKREVIKAITDVYGLTPPMGEVVSDFLLVNPVIELLKAHATSNSQKNTFFYVFKDFDPLRFDQDNEISYIFSNKVYYWKYHSAVPDYRHLVSDARTEELKPGYGIGNSPRPDLYPFVLLISLLANFVRSGDPNVIDPNERFPSSNVKPWPKFERKLGRYLELGKEVEFPSGYRRVYMQFWSRTFPELIKTFGNHSTSSMDSINNYFPPPSNPYFPPRRNNPDFNNVNVNDRYPYDPPSSDPSDDGGAESNDSVLSGIGQSTVVLIGALLLLLNFLCFIGLFYQRERLKKTEIQLRRRFLDSRSSHNPEMSQEMDTASASFERAAIPVQHNTTGGGIIAERGVTPNRDAMSETETENGFGPDFLGPNYDPRTKVNRWMNTMQNNRGFLSQQNSFENQSSSQDYPLRRDMIDGSAGLSVLPVPLQPNSHHHPHYHAPPLHIQVTSLQRNSNRMSSNMDPQQQQQNHHYHNTSPIHILPPLPYQEPFQPSASVVGDIPYADSRATSPLPPIYGPGTVSNSPAHFHHPQYGTLGSNHKEGSLKRPGSAASPTMVTVTPPGPSTNISQQGNTSSNNTVNPFQQLNPGGSSPLSASAPPQNASSQDNPSSSSSPTSSNKRTSVVIVRDLDPVDPQLDETKLVPVKTGTLKRSVGVDTGNHQSHDGSPPEKNKEEASSSTGNNNNNNSNKRGSSQIRVTFSEQV